MSAMTRPFRRFGVRRRKEAAQADLPLAPVSDNLDVVPIDIAPNDPILAFFQSAPGAVDIDSLDLDSPARDALREAGVKIVVPLVSQGELIGLLNLGPRLSEQDYSGDDRKLLDTLAGQAAPAVRVAQLVRQQEAQARERERVEQELKVAQLIQQQFLPRKLPDLPGWHVAAFYRPAREVGGDFYDFIELPEGKIGIVVGDVTDKGVPAALVMATTHALLRSDAPRLVSPSEVLQSVNELLVQEMPPKMFVTCLYAVLDPGTGKLQYANAGHNLPYVGTDEGVVEFRATGMPLGLLPGMTYEQKEATLDPGQSILLHSDGLAEAHNPHREMFGFPRLMKLMESRSVGEELIDELLADLDKFVGPNTEQEDDITLVTLQRSPGAGVTMSGGNAAAEDERVLADFTIPSEPGNERLAIDQVTEAVSELELEPKTLERLKTAVGEATMNAIEHGNKNQADVPVEIRVLVLAEELHVKITDQGGDQEVAPREQPDLEAKLAGEQTTRGWGLVLIENMVDAMDVSSNGTHHTIQLTIHMKGDSDER